MMHNSDFDSLIHILLVQFCTVLSALIYKYVIYSVDLESISSLHHDH